VRALLAPDSTPSVPAPSDSPLASPARLRVFIGRLLVSLLIAAGFVWLLARGGLPMLPPSAALGRLAWWAAPLYALLTCIATALRTYRWLHLLRPIQPQLSTRYAWGSALVGFAAVVFAPLRMGEMARPWLISRRGGVRFMQATGSVAAERVVDGLLLMSILAVGLAFAQQLSPLPDRIGALQVPVALVPAIASSALLTFALAFTLMAAFYFFH
jgi:glycosyltransferase 2 family protein